MGGASESDDPGGIEIEELGRHVLEDVDGQYLSRSSACLGHRLLARNGSIQDMNIPEAVFEKEVIPEICDPEFIEIEYGKNDDESVEGLPPALMMSGMPGLQNQITKQEAAGQRRNSKESSTPMSSSRQL